MTYLLMKWLHIIGATVLLGTGAGIAFFMWRAQRTRDVRVLAAVAADVVRADLWFTATAVLIQPLTGFALMSHGGWTLSQHWLRESLALYGLVGCCWLPVLWLQWRMRDMARLAVAGGSSLPARYFRYFRCWVVLGGPAFAGVLLILWLMVSKTRLW